MTKPRSEQKRKKDIHKIDFVRFNARNGLVAGNPELLFDPNALEAAALSFGKAIATAHLDATAADLSGGNIKGHP